MSLPPCQYCGAEYPPGKIGTVHKPDCPVFTGEHFALVCERCGCPLLNEDRPEPKTPFDAYRNVHADPTLCLIALEVEKRRKENP